jgi:hypothetical protein
MFKPTDKVRVPEGPFAGMNGIVGRGKGKAPIVNFGGGFRVVIEAWLLRPDDGP